MVARRIAGQLVRSVVRPVVGVVPGGGALSGGGAEVTVPGAPTNVVAVAGDTEAEVSFDAPASDGGATITQYDVTSDPGGVTASGASSPITVTGLTNGVEVTFTVTATNSVGEGPASDPSNAVTPAAAGYTTSGSYYDGTNDYANWSPGGINGGVDTGAGQGIFSIWVKAGSDGTAYALCDTGFPSGLKVSRLVTTNTLKCLSRTDAVIQVNANTSTTLVSGAWHHILVAWDYTDATSTNNWFYCYFDGAQVLADVDIAQGLANFSGLFRIGADSSGVDKFLGDVSEIYVQLGETLDITDSVVRAKFRDGDGKPVSLGADGSTPTGTQPKVYAPNGDPSTNLGSAGNATIVGALTASSTSPTD